MATDADIFKNKVAELIKSWDPENIEYLTEVNLGMRFDKTPRKIDIVIYHKLTNKTLGIECKLQRTSGTAYEKLPYALDDCLNSPVATLIAFAGGEIRADMRSKLITSGVGIELGYKLNKYRTITSVLDPQNIFRQRVYIELGLNWLPFASSKTLYQEDYGDAYCDSGPLTKTEKSDLINSLKISKDALEELIISNTELLIPDASSARTKHQQKAHSK